MAPKKSGSLGVGVDTSGGSARSGVGKAFSGRQRRHRDYDRDAREATKPPIKDPTLRTSLCCY